MKNRLDDLIAAWQEHAASAHTLSEHDEDQAYRSLGSRVLDAARQDPTLLDQLRDVATGALPTPTSSTTTGITFAGMVGGVLTPYPYLALQDPAAFLDHVEVSFSPQTMPIAPAVVLPVAEALVTSDYARQQLDYPWTWFAGVPLGRADDVWPRREDGSPLHHVLQMDLGEEAGNLGDLTVVGLPETGFLQLFHDLTTYGEPGDAASGAWQVR